MSKPVFTETELTAGVERRPSIDTLHDWLMDGVGEATDGCSIENDGTCEHGCRAWMVVLGYV